jgi:hypothetical protein
LVFLAFVNRHRIPERANLSFLLIKNKFFLIRNLEKEMIFPFFKKNLKL